MKSPTVQDAFRAGLQHHQAGRYQQAETLYRLALDNDTRNADVLHILGVLLHQTGRNGESIDLIRRAIEVDPSVPDFHNNLGNVLRVWNRLDEAVAEFRAAIAINSEYAEAHANLGSALQDQGKLDEAIESYAAALRLRADLPEIHNNLGITLHAKGEPTRAIDSFKEAIRLKPDFVEAHHNLASALQASNQLDAAENHFITAIRLAPDFYESRLHLSSLLHTRGRLSDAEAQLRKLIELNPEYVPAYNNLANLFLDTGRIEEAIRACEAAITLRPDLPQPHIALASSMLTIGRLDEAIGCYRNALNLQPDDPQTHNRLGIALFNAGLLDEAVAEYRTAIQLDPDLIQAADHCLYARHFDPAYDSNRLLEEHRAWSARYAESLRPQGRPHGNDNSPDRKLRIGYISPDFRNHPTGRFLLPLFVSHNRTNFHITAYSDVRNPDEITQELRKHTDAWHDIAGLPDSELADLIRSHQIDILVDLSLHAPGNRLLTFARKPVPVQITHLAYPSTTGLSTIDFRITNPLLDPPSPSPLYTEANLPIPTYLCYRPPVTSPEVSELPAIKAGHITFGCIDHPAKISAITLKLWREILDSTPNSKLLLCIPPGQAQTRITDAIGLPDRIEFAAPQPFPYYLDTLQRIDIALDTNPFNSVATTCDTLWMGVPTVTLKGQTAVGRVGSSILTSAGLPELIAETPEQYIQIARDLASNRDQLTSLRASLRTRLSQSPLCDASAYTTNLENAYRAAWRKWC